MTGIELENFMMLVSITIGVGLTKMFDGLAQLVRKKDLAPDMVHVTWFLIVFMLNVEFVWNIRLQTEMRLSLLQLLIYMLGPVFLFLSSDFFALDEEKLSGSTFDYFIANRGFFLSALALYLASQVVVAVFIKGESLAFPQNYFRYAGLVILAVGIASKNRIIHIAISGVSFMTLVVYIITTDLMT
jgi:hypothetical protein